MSEQKTNQPKNNQRRVTLERGLLLLVILLQCGILLSFYRSRHPGKAVREYSETVPEAVIEPVTNRVSIMTSPDSCTNNGHRVSDASLFDMNALLRHAQAEFEQMQHLVDFDRGWSALAATPSMDIWNQNKDYIVIFSLPNIDRAKLRVTLDGRLLTVSSEARVRAQRASHYQSYSRSIWLPGPVDSDQQAYARVTNGVLRITIPKADTQPPTPAPAPHNTLSL